MFLLKKSSLVASLLCFLRETFISHGGQCSHELAHILENSGLYQGGLKQQIEAKCGTLSIDPIPCYRLIVQSKPR